MNRERTTTQRETLHAEWCEVLAEFREKAPHLMGDLRSARERMMKVLARVTREGTHADVELLLIKLERCAELCEVYADLLLARRSTLHLIQPPPPLDEKI